MITQLTVEQVARRWGTLKPCIESALPPVASRRAGRMNEVLTQLMAGALQCWIIHQAEGERQRVEGVMVTMLTIDPATKGKSALIYALYGDKLTMHSWIDGLQLVKAWAMSEGCESVTAYSCNPDVVKMAQRLGGSVDYTYISFDMGGE